MKTAKFLTLLATASMFVACVEDLAPVENENFQQEMEVVGGEVIGTDVTMDIPVTGVQTKYADGVAGWDKDDKVGLGWLRYDGENLTDDKTLYANHLFYRNVEANRFEARGNIYKGWHFAYYPYQYMEEVGQLTLNLNPAQEVSILNAEGTTDNTGFAKRLAQRFHVSALQYLTRESLVEPDYNQIKNEVDLVPITPLAQIVFRTEPAEGSAFATKDNLKAYKIKSVRFYTGGPNFFATEAILNPAKLHQYSSVESVDNAVELKKSFKDAFETERGMSIELNVEKAGYTVGKKSAALAYTLPYTGTQKISISTHLEPEKTYFRVTTDKGDFTIKYVKDAEEGTWQDENNKAFLAIKAAFEGENGVMRRSAMRNDDLLAVTFKLHEKNFGLNWDVDGNDAWNAKVELASDLEIAKPEFVLVNDAVIDINTVTIPEGGVTLAGAGKLTVAADWTWNEDIKFADGSAIDVVVAEKKTLTVNSELAPKSLVNNGTINTTVAEGYSEAVLKNLTNNGEVKVGYGAQVYPATGYEGVISFEVKDYTPAQIKKVIAVGAEPADGKTYANVNTLIVGEGKEIDFTPTVHTDGTDGDDDPYAPINPTPGSSSVDKPYGDNLSAINFVLNGGSIKSSDMTQPFTVKNVTMTDGKVANVAMTALTIVDGENIVEATAISGGVTVKAGKNTIEAVTITGNVEVKAGAGNITAETINGNIDINGNYTVKATSVTGNIEAKGENYFNEVPTINGNVTLTNTTNTGCALSGNTINGNLTLTGEGFGLENVTVNTVTLKDGSVKVFNTTVNDDFNVEKGNANIIVSSIAGTLTNAGTVTIKGETTMKNIVNNGTFTSYVDLVVENITLNPKSVTTLTSNGEDFDGTIWYTGAYENNNMTLNGAVVKYGYYGELLRAEIDAATPGTTVTLKGDVQLNTFLTINKDVTIDLKGKNITTVETWEDGGSNSYIFHVTGGGDLTLKGEGRVETAPSDYGMCVWAADGGKVTIEGGDYYSPGLETAACDCIYAKNGGVVIINGGKFGHSGPLTNGGAVVNSHNSSPGSITVNGGTFYGTLVYEDGDIDNGSVVWGEGAVILE